MTNYCGRKKRLDCMHPSFLASVSDMMKLNVKMWTLVFVLPYTTLGLSLPSSSSVSQEEQQPSSASSSLTSLTSSLSSSSSSPVAVTFPSVWGVAAEDPPGNAVSRTKRDHKSSERQSLQSSTSDSQDTADADHADVTEGAGLVPPVSPRSAAQRHNSRGTRGRSEQRARPLKKRRRSRTKCQRSKKGQRRRKQRKCRHSRKKDRNGKKRRRKGKKKRKQKKRKTGKRGKKRRKQTVVRVESSVAVTVHRVPGH
ncbi:uncharacterized protein LOC143283123 isoform X3 [Babylonia areolata]|uniref:uncharacterized protein LOC143283123 isoform X3 n=1 Tax=Babylonia areolata TaxID=304850 RepID=UPI003FD08EA5